MPRSIQGCSLVQFSKLEGLGNDFLVFEDSGDTSFSADQIRKICHRSFGVGADGLIVVGKENGFFRMHLFNSDGTRAQMSGNGIRCLGRFLYDRGLVNGATVSVATDAGPRVLEFHVSRDRLSGIKVDMGEPDFARASIPMRGDGEAVEVDVPLAQERVLGTALSVGNPHFVLWVDRVESAPVNRLGPEIETSDEFPERTNVEFVQALDERTLRMRVWERGVGETLACGTGACAAVAAAARTGRTGREVAVELPGGTARVTWAADNRLYLTGPAHEICRGELTIEM